MIVPPQAVMLTAHVGDSLRCLIANSRQAGVTRPALHKKGVRVVGVAVVRSEGGLSLLLFLLGYR